MNIWTLDLVRSRCTFEGDCWIWGGSKVQGYPQATINGRGGQMVRKWVFEHAKGPVPKSMRVTAKCDNKACVNPKHLRLANPSAILSRCYEKGKRSSLGQYRQS